jgi:hypothetical protein
MRSYNETRAGPDIFEIQVIKGSAPEERAEAGTHGLSLADPAYFALTGLAQRELECRSKGYPFVSPSLFAIPS